MVNPPGSHDLDAPSAPVLDGGSWIGKYQVIRRLAVGGMAEIYLVRAVGIEQFEKVLVLKRILPQYASDHRFIQMFLDEARLAATFSHPNIAQVYDIGSAGGSYFFTMEHIHGEDVAHILAAAERTGQPPPYEHALAIAMGVAAGLHAAHEKVGPDGQPLNVVHRDVSPSNVIVGYDGGVKVVDFGVAKAASQRTKTETGALRGKLRYMSPEQFGRAPLDRRSDVFALGVLLYELTTGRRPFDDESEASVMRSILDGDFVPPSRHRSGYPRELERIVVRALRVDRDKRFATAQDLQLALEELARGKKLAVSPVALGRYMQGLFSAKVDAWRAARQAGRTLGEHLASAPGSQPTGGTESLLAPPLPAPGAPAALAPEAARKGQRRLALLVPVGLALVAAAAVALATGLSRGGRAPEMVAPAPAPKTPQAAAPAPAPKTLEVAAAAAPPASRAAAAAPSAPTAVPAQDAVAPARQTAAEKKRTPSERKSHKAKAGSVRKKRASSRADARKPYDPDSPFEPQ